MTIIKGCRTYTIFFQYKHSSNTTDDCTRMLVSRNNDWACAVTRNFCNSLFLNPFAVSCPSVLIYAIFPLFFSSGRWERCCFWRLSKTGVVPARNNKQATACGNFRLRAQLLASSQHAPHILGPGVTAMPLLLDLSQLYLSCHPVQQINKLI